MSELEQYDYDLPPELIAQQPLARRSDARLLVVRRSSCAIDHRHIRDLPDLLSPGDTLVLNDTRVVPARLVGYRTATGGRWTGLFLGADPRGQWRLLSKTRGKLTAGETIQLVDRQSREAAILRLLARMDDGGWIAAAEPPTPPLELLERIGRVPLPPYIRGGEMQETDLAEYQTVFAEKPGAVAAPTAGLHFTDQLLGQLHERGIGICRITLHVGLGTFRPISVERLDEHQMHREWGCVTAETVEQLAQCRAGGGRIVAVGTTVVRVLETASAGGRLQSWQGETDLFIRPPYQFRSVDALLTNFHLPRSTLLVLVSTFAGRQQVSQAYAAAIDQRYRFYSYGDAMLIL